MQSQVGSRRSFWRNLSPWQSSAQKKKPSPQKNNYIYQPLDARYDSIRLLTFQGSRYDLDIKCTLKTWKISDISDYDALSYTWESSSQTRRIYIDGSAVLVGRNLFIALRHIREFHNNPIWIDAICINQSDIEEKNQQIPLMRFIYKRAKYVLVWLGRWTAPSHVQTISKAVIKGDHSQLQGSILIRKIIDHHYWKRMWIVQEICQSVHPLFCFQDSSNAYTLKWEELLSLSSGYSSANKESFDRIVKCRESPYGDILRLEMLLEAFHDQRCREIHDKIYGLLGLANDYVHGNIKTDYNESLFNLFKDVVKFVYSSRPLRIPWSDGALDRRARVVKFAELVQRALEGKLAKELQSRQKTPSENGEQEESPIQATGYIGGVVKYLGPSFQDYMSSYLADDKWRSMSQRVLIDAQREDDLERHREMEDMYSRKIRNYHEDELFRIQDLMTNTTWAYKPRHADRSLSLQNEIPTEQDLLNTTLTENQDAKPRLFQTGNLCMGLAPPAAREGDIVVRFWGSQRALLVRPEEIHFENAEVCYNVIGTADVSDWVQETHPLSPEEISTEDRMLFGSPVEVFFDMATLQILTS